MNKTIRELAKQAQNNEDSFEFFDPVFAEKFADLIIRECVSILEPKSGYIGDGPVVLKDKISQIKKHFGVE